MKLELPQFSRIFSAPIFTRTFSVTEKIVLWSMLVSLFVFNSFLRLTKPPFYWSDMLTILKTPFVASYHINLAQTYWEKRLFEPAKIELRIASDLAPQAAANGDLRRVLGAATGPLDLLSLWANEPERLQKEAVFWQNVILEKPDYRDAYIILGTLEYQLGNLIVAKSYLTRALTLDPNASLPQQLLKLMR